MPLRSVERNRLAGSCIKVRFWPSWAGGEIGQTIGNGYRRQPAIQNLGLVPGDGLDKSSHTGGLRDGNPRHDAAGDPDSTRTRLSAGRPPLLDSSRSE